MVVGRRHHRAVFLAETAENLHSENPVSGRRWDHENGINNNLSVLWKSLRRIVVSHPIGRIADLPMRICPSGLGGVDESLECRGCCDHNPVGYDWTFNHHRLLDPHRRAGLAVQALT